MIKEELGSDWLTNYRFRIGASSLVDKIIDDICRTYSIGATASITQAEHSKNENIDSKKESVDSKKENVEKTQKKIKSRS